MSFFTTKIVSIFELILQNISSCSRQTTSRTYWHQLLTFLHTIYTACFVVWRPRCAADTSTNWWQGFLCCCTASTEQMADRPEAAAIDRLISASTENIPILFCLWAPKNRLFCFAMRPRSSSESNTKYLVCCYSCSYMHSPGSY